MPISIIMCFYLMILINIIPLINYFLFYAIPHYLHNASFPMIFKKSRRQVSSVPFIFNNQNSKLLMIYLDIDKKANAFKFEKSRNQKPACCASRGAQGYSRMAPGIYGNWQAWHPHKFKTWCYIGTMYTVQWEIIRMSNCYQNFFHVINSYIYFIVKP